MELGHIIAQLRAEKKISQRELAKELNVSAGVVGLWETNKRLPSLECFLSLVDYFNVSADALLINDREKKFFSTNGSMSPNAGKLLETYNLLDEDNQDILIGKAKELLKQQRLEEKRRIIPTAKAT